MNSSLPTRNPRGVSPIDVLAGFAVVASGVMMAMLSLHRFDAGTALFVSVIAMLGIAWAFRWRIAWPERRTSLAIALLLLAACALRWSPFLYTEGGQDQGLYVSMSAHFERAHGPSIIDTVRASLPENQRAAYDKLNNSPYVLVPHRDEGWHQPGVYISDLERSEYVFQFYPLHPLWMAAAARLVGTDNRIYSLVAFSVLGILMLAMLAYELSGRRRAPAFIAAVLLAVNPIHVFLSRFPVSENVTLFFSASALYFLVRYLRDRDAGEPRAGDLVLSAGSWGAMFFAHIGGFLYAPLFLLFVLAGTATARSAAQMRHMLFYGVAIIVAYLLSLWYGDVWSFPYSFDVYRAIVGDKWAASFLAHYVLVGVASAALLVGAVLGAWRRREAIVSSWQRARPNAAAAAALTAIMAGIVMYGLFDAFRLGFTDYYAKDPWLATRWNLSHTGVRAVLHASIVALTLYVSPVVMLALLAPAVARWRALDAYMLGALALVAMFLFLRTATEVRTTTYYYYGRYLGAELVPYLSVIAAVFLGRMYASGAAARAAAIALLAFALAWEAVALSFQYPGGEMHRFDASAKPLVGQLRDHDVLLLAGGEYPALQTALDYYYGRKSVKVDPTRLWAAIRQYAPHFADVYVLSNVDQLTEGAYVGAVTLVQDSYRRADTWDVLPRYSEGYERRLYLYRVQRPQLQVLHIGDVVDFGSGGTGAAFVASGWSGQEQNYRWTEGEAATLALQLGGAPEGLVLRFEVRAHACVPVTVRANGQIRAHWKFSDCTGVQTREVRLTPKDVIDGGTTLVALEMPTVKSPHELDPAFPDTRKLGLAVMRLWIDKPGP